MIKKAIPILPTNNLKSTTDFFENNLGFTAINIGSCVVMKNGDAEIQLEFNSDRSGLTTASCCLYVNNIEDFFTTLSSRDIIGVTGKLSESVFGIKEFCITDNNGNKIHFREQKQTT